MVLRETVESETPLKSFTRTPCRATTGRSPWSLSSSAPCSEAKACQRVTCTLRPLWSKRVRSRRISSLLSDFLFTLPNGPALATMPTTSSSMRLPRCWGRSPIFVTCSFGLMFCSCSALASLHSSISVRSEMVSW